MRRFFGGIAASFGREVGRLIANREYRMVVWWMPLGVILFFAVFFSREVVGTLPVGVVDEDDSYLSRRLVGMLRATHEVADIDEFASIAEARTRVLNGDVVGVVEIPAGFARNILSGVSTEVVYYDSGTNISTSSLSSKGVQSAVTTFGVGVALQRAEIAGAMPDEAMAQAMPIAFTTYALSNPWLNYAYYVAPCFCVLILVIATMLSTIYAIGTELRYGTIREWLRSANGSFLGAMMGKLALPTLAMWALATIVGVLIFGVYGAPMRGEWWVLMVGVVALVVAYQAVAVFIVALTKSLRLSLSLGGGYAVLAFTFSGVTFPTMAMFEAVQPLTRLFPYTYFMELYIDQISSFVR